MFFFHSFHRTGELITLCILLFTLTLKKISFTFFSVADYTFFFFLKRTFPFSGSLISSRFRAFNVQICVFACLPHVCVSRFFLFVFV